MERFKSCTGTSASSAIDQIIRRSEPKPSRLKNVNGLLVLDLPDAGPKVRVTTDDIKRAEDKMDREYAERVPQSDGAASLRKKKSGRR